MPDIGNLLGDILGGSWRFRQGPSSFTSGFGMLPQGWRQGPQLFTPRADRWFALTVEPDLMNLPTLPERMTEALHQRLIINLGDAAQKVLDDAGDSLYKPADFPRHRHGLDTGRMKDGLTARLLEQIGVGVWYDLYSEGAPYWVFVEFGRLRDDGSWWPGYHFLSAAIVENYQYIQNAVRVAVHETMALLAAEASVDQNLPPSVSSLRPDQGPGGALLEQYE